MQPFQSSFCSHRYSKTQHQVKKNTLLKITPVKLQKNNLFAKNSCKFTKNIREFKKKKKN